LPASIPTDAVITKMELIFDAKVSHSRGVYLYASLAAENTVNNYISYFGEYESYGTTGSATTSAYFDYSAVRTPLITNTSDWNQYTL
jgi:hypothetical protein